MSNSKRNQTSGSPQSPRFNVSDFMTSLQGSVKGFEYQQQYSSFVFGNKSSNYTPNKYTQNTINYLKGQQSRTSSNAKMLKGFNNKVLGPIGGIFAYKDQVKNSEATTDIGKQISGVGASIASMKINPVVAFADMVSGGNISKTVNKGIDKSVVYGEKFANYYSNMDFETGKDDYQNFKDFSEL